MPRFFFGSLDNERFKKQHGSTKVGQKRFIHGQLRVSVTLSVSTELGKTFSFDIFGIHQKFPGKVFLFIEFLA